MSFSKIEDTVYSNTVITDGPKHYSNQIFIYLTRRRQFWKVLSSYLDHAVSCILN